MKCPKCKENHSPNHPHLSSWIHDTGFPTHAKKYKEAHRQANKAEKAKYPKGYEEMKKIDRQIPKHELAGKNTQTGGISVSKRVPAKLRKEVAYHEKVENKILRKGK